MFQLHGYTHDGDIGPQTKTHGVEFRGGGRKNSDFEIVSVVK